MKTIPVSSSSGVAMRAILKWRIKREIDLYIFSYLMTFWYKKNHSPTNQWFINISIDSTLDLVTTLRRLIIIGYKDENYL